MRRVGGFHGQGAGGNEQVWQGTTAPCTSDGTVRTTRWDFYRRNYNALKPMFPQFVLWCQFCSVIACDPRCEVAGTKWVCSSALVRPFPVDLTNSSLIDNTFHPENKQTNKTSETPSYNAWIYLQWTAKKLQMLTFIKSEVFSTSLEHLYNAAYIKNKS